MLIVLKPGASKEDADEIMGRIGSAGLKPLYMPGVERTVIGAIGDERILGRFHIDSHPMVESVTPVLSPYKLVSRDFKKDGSVVKIGKVPLGGRLFAVVAGSCAIESGEQFLSTAQEVAKSGAHILRGGAYKPRSSPYSFQGLGLEALKILKDVSLKTGMPTVTEVLELADVEAVDSYADAFQVGARNMQNFRLLNELGSRGKPVILKRGMAASCTDLLLAAEYIVAAGNPNVILCERGIRTFETATRNTLDLAAIPHLKAHSHLPVLVDPSHGTGVRDYVPAMSFAAAAAGADGIMVEVHCNPSEALSDGAQSLFPAQFKSMMEKLEAFVSAAGREL